MKGYVDNSSQVNQMHKQTERNIVQTVLHIHLAPGIKGYLDRGRKLIEKVLYPKAYSFYYKLAKNFCTKINSMLRSSALVDKDN